MNTVIITGAAGNLGATVTNFFLEKGYTVLATIASPQEEQKLPKHASLHLFTVDLSNEHVTEKFVAQAIQQHGAIKGCLMLAGGFTAGKIASTTIEDIQGQLSLNFFTAYAVARPVLAHMLANASGRLVFVGARPALKSSQGKDLVAYSLSKSLLFKLAELINEEAKDKNVTASVVAPSTIDTPLNRKSMPDANSDDWVKPEALARILEFIVSEDTLREPVYKVYNNA